MPARPGVDDPPRANSPTRFAHAQAGRDAASVDEDVDWALVRDFQWLAGWISVGGEGEGRKDEGGKDEGKEDGAGGSADEGGK